MTEESAKHIVESLYQKQQQSPDVSSAIYRLLSQINFYGSDVRCSKMNVTEAEKQSTNDNKTLMFKGFDGTAIVFKTADGSAFFE